MRIGWYACQPSLIYSCSWMLTFLLNLWSCIFFFFTVTWCMRHFHCQTFMLFIVGMCFFWFENLTYDDTIRQLKAHLLVRGQPVCISTLSMHWSIHAICLSCIIVVIWMIMCMWTMYRTELLSWMVQQLCEHHELIE